MLISNGEIELLLNFLEDHGNTLGNAGCNDFWLEATPENLQLIREYSEADGYSEENGNAKDAPWQTHDGRILTYDWWVCAHIRRKVHNYLTQKTGGV